MVRILIDMQGADRPAAELVPGAVQAVRTYEDLEILMTGAAAELEPAVKVCAEEALMERIQIIDAPDTVTNFENPMDAFFKKPDASMVKGIKMVQTDETIGAFASCGATGALFTSAIMTLGRRMKKRPVLLCPAVKMNGQVFAIVDCGANVDCRPEVMVDFARVGTAFMKSRGIASPKVALLSNGAEKGKGNDLVKEVYGLLEESGLNFTGNVEGSEVLYDDVDVVVCEGFAGNVLMKTLEGTSRTVLSELEKRMCAAGDVPAEKVHAAVDEMLGLTDYNSKGAALMLGLAKPVIKGHGAANAETMFHVARTAYEAVKNDLTGFIKAETA